MSALKKIKLADGMVGSRGASSEKRVRESTSGFSRDLKDQKKYQTEERIANRQRNSKDQIEERISKRD